MHLLAYVSVLINTSHQGVSRDNSSDTVAILIYYMSILLYILLSMSHTVLLVGMCVA